MTHDIHIDPERIKPGLWSSILSRLKALWMSGISTIMYCGRIWRIKK